MKYVGMMVLGLALLAGPLTAAENETITDPGSRISYSLGYQIGKDLKQQERDISPDTLMQGVVDGLAGSEPQLDNDEMSTILQSLKKDIKNTQLEKRREKDRQIKETYRGEGREFLAENAKTDGVVTLPSGLQYKIEKQGTGKAPGPHDTVVAHYRGTLLDGNEFYSTYSRNAPAEFRVDGVIAGMGEALQLMHEGAKWRIFVPADLAYGERGPLKDRTVIFDIELLEVKPEK